jgi:hypothetical protein
MSKVLKQNRPAKAAAIDVQRWLDMQQSTQSGAASHDQKATDGKQGTASKARQAGHGKQGAASSTPSPLLAPEIAACSEGTAYNSAQHGTPIQPQMCLQHAVSILHPHVLQAALPGLNPLQPMVASGIASTQEYNAEYDPNLDVSTLAAVPDAPDPAL